MAGTPYPVTIRGVSYPSMSQAAKEFGISVSAIYSAKRDGRLEYVGTMPMKTAALIAKLAKAAPEDFPELQKEAKRWIAFRSRK